jgi:ribosomal protein S18 acetylase RimI-like enzyme
VEPNGVAIRPATASDVPAIFDLLEVSFAGYSAFAPDGWVPPQPGPDERAMMADAFDRPEVWYVVASDEHGHAGQCGIVQAYTERWMQGEPIDGLAHFWQLFVRPDTFGTGLADRLHAMAIDAIRERGFARARLWTPEGQSRARRFYEKRGWYLNGERQDEGPFGIPLVMYVKDI